MATEATLRKRLNQLGPEIKAVVELGRKIKTDPSNLFMFKGVYKSLRDTYSSYTAAWDALEDLSAAGQAEVLEKDVNTMQNVKRYFHEANAIYEDHMNPTPQPPSTQTSFLNESRLVRANLPRINLPKFGGNYSDWPTFRDTYTSLIHGEATIPKIEKFHFLLACLVGPARSLLRSIPLQEDNYDQAWTTLTETYDNKRVLAMHHLNALLDFKPLPAKPNLSLLKAFISDVGENIQAFKLLNVPSADEFILFALAIRCLDPTTRRDFEKKNLDSDFPKFDSLIKFVKDECRTLELSDVRSTNLSSDSVPRNSDLKSKFKTALVVDAKSTRPTGRKGKPSTSKPTNSCPVCKDTHSLYSCSKFRQATNNYKRKLLSNWKGCLNCLNPNHITKVCSSTHNCNICSKRHHTWLHLDDDSGSMPVNNGASTREDSSSNNQSGQTLGPTSVSLSTNARFKDVLLGTALATIKDYRGNFQPVRMVLDCGSQCSFISYECLKRLRLCFKPSTVTISGIGQTSLAGSYGIAQCTIRPSKGKLQLKTNAVVVDCVTSELPHVELPSEFLEAYKTFELADPTFYQPGNVEFLVGADLYFDIVMEKPITIEPSFPKLIPTILGHVVAGPYQSHCEQALKRHALYVHGTNNLSDEISKFWQIEEIQSQPMHSPSDLYCEQHFTTTQSRTPEGRYIIRLPFKESFPRDLSESKGQALKRFYSLESKLARNPTLRLEYVTFMDEYLNLNHMELAKEPGSYFIPHHSIIKEDGDNFKIRVVFDASASTCTGSLNDFLHTGPKLHKDIADILIKFRCHPIAFTADIVKMYRQILLSPEDRKYQHIFWRSDPSQSLQEYHLNTLSYGLSVAPFLALRVIQQLVKDEGFAYPLASRALTEEIYVDDIVTGASDIDSAYKLKEELVYLLHRGGFELSKWASNAPNLINGQQQVPLNLASHETCLKILGLQWDPTRDIFTYRIKPMSNIFTKRTVLSIIARIYDPVGYIAPIVFYAKHILQTLWKEKLDWDDKLPLHLQQTWSHFISQLPVLCDVSIPRYIWTHGAAECDVIGFSDASERGYSAVIYLRVVNDGKITSHLIKSKTKLAPTKPLTIPRLELCGALLLARVYTSLQEFLHRLPIREHYWFTDSTIVLGWLKTSPYKLKTFVAHRIVAITEKTQTEDWYHISSETNAADCASRGILPSDLLQHPIWWNGPSWLTADRNNWPIQNMETESFSDLPEMKPALLTTLVAEGKKPYLIEWTERFSCYGRLLRVMCYVLRFVNMLLARKPKKTGAIQAKELEIADRTFIRLIQNFYLGQEFPDSELLPLSISLRRLNAMRDEQNIIRVGGRLQNSNLPEKSIHPILIPKCHYAKILIDYHHRAYLHLGPSALRAMLQRTYWILSARTLIKQRIHRCLKCFKESQRPKEPFMGVLPASRFVEGKPFQHTGVDFGGPFIVRESPRRKSLQTKAYLSLFICMTTKSVHLELVSNCTTEAFLAAFDRFISRRGAPYRMYSDCGSNFIGAANKLKELLKWQRLTETQNDIMNHASSKGIEWSFNPPHAPHFGGLWEAGIKSVKTILRKVMGETPFTFEELCTIFARIEAILNSRPLLTLESDPESYESLTPGHFLIGCPITGRPEETLWDTKENRLDRWQLVQQRTEHYWRRWRTEYLHQLQQRNKWIKHEPNHKVGDLVVVNEANAPPLNWPLARVHEIHPGEDGVVRVITLRFASGVILKRPVTKVISLAPVTSSENMET